MMLYTFCFKLIFCKNKKQKHKKGLTKRESFVIILKQSKIWCSSQVVRPRSATPLSAGSNPACTSKEKGIPFGIPFFFPLEVQALDLKRFRTPKRTKAGSHTPLEDRKARFSVAECGYLPKAYPGCTSNVS